MTREPLYVVKAVSMDGGCPVVTREPLSPRSALVRPGPPVGLLSMIPACSKARSEELVVEGVKPVR